MAQNDNTFGCVAIIIFLGSLYISAVTDIPIFGYLIGLVFLFILLLIIVDIFSPDRKWRSIKQKKNTPKSLVNFDRIQNETKDRESKSSSNNPFSFSKIIIWLFITFCIVTCASKHRVGAVCNDGSTSNSTGSGTCSQHEGVRSWKDEYWWD